MAWVPPEWSRAADRVLDGLGATDPVADAPAPPRPATRRKPDRRGGRARALPRRRPRRLRRGRPPLAVEAGPRRRRRAWSSRCSFPTFRSSFAGGAARRSAARASSSSIGVSDRLIVDSREWDRPAARATRGWPSSSSGSSSPTSPGHGRCRWRVATRRSVARDQAGADGLGRRPARRRAAAARLAALAASDATSGCATRTPSSLPRVEVDGEAVAARARLAVLARATCSPTELEPFGARPRVRGGGPRGVT